MTDMAIMALFRLEFASSIFFFLFPFKLFLSLGLNMFLINNIQLDVDISGILLCSICLLFQHFFFFFSIAFFQIDFFSYSSFHLTGLKVICSVYILLVVTLKILPCPIGVAWIMLPTQGFPCPIPRTCKTVTLHG